MEEERGAVIDGVQLAVPHEQVRVARGAIDVEHEGVEPHQKRSFGRRRGIARGGVEHRRAGEVVESDIKAGAGFEQVADFGIGLIAAEGRVDFCEHQIGHAQAEDAADFAGDDFRDEREDALARSAKFDDVEAEVVGFDNGGQRTAFAKGKHVARGADGAEHAR